MKATSDSGLAVEYYVAYGSGLIFGSKLMTSELPGGARFPVEVTVVAWQFGRGIDPLVRTATPVEQTIRIEKP